MKTNQILIVATLVTILFTGCDQNKNSTAATDSGTHAQPSQSEYSFALVAKSQDNPVFEAARVGAEDAADAIGKKLGVKINILWRTPNEEDAQVQVQYLDQLTLQGVNGISVSCTEAPTLQPAINRAVEASVPVMCFDSDAPDSKRFCYYGTDDNACGHTIMKELAKVLGPGRHVIAIPGGNQNSLNIQNRVRGATDEATNYPNITIQGVFYSKEVPQDAAARMQEVQTAHPDIDGWAMVGSWALFTDALLNWEPGKIKIVAMDALPAELPYVRKGVVQELFAQQTYQWGWQSVELLSEKVIQQKDPAAIEYSPLIEVTQTNVDEFEQNWKKWLRQ
jgi:ribose transport system substrate-binding protein